MGMIYQPNRLEAIIAEAAGAHRNKYNNGSFNQPNKPDEAQMLRWHIESALAEIAVSRWANLNWSGLGWGNNERPVDVGGSLEVKSIDDSSKNLIVKEKAMEGGYPFVLVYVAPNNSCHFMGWAYPSDIKERGRILSERRQGITYIMSKKHLRPWGQLVNYLMACYSPALTA